MSREQSFVALYVQMGGNMDLLRQFNQVFKVHRNSDTEVFFKALKEQLSGDGLEM